MTFVALVTGASSGIGEATAKLLASQPDVQLVLVARRKERLQELAKAIQPNATIITADLTLPSAAKKIAEKVAAEHGQLNLLVNNAGARWSMKFADGGYENVAQTMKLNFDAQVRLTEALLPLLRATAAKSPARADGAGAAKALTGEARVAPVSIVNVSSTAGRVARSGSAAYSASKFALSGWTDGLALELAPEGIHVGLVNPGFIATEGFPAAELREKWLTSLIVDTPEHAAQAIVKAGPGGLYEIYVPRYYWLAAAVRILAPSFLRKRLMKSSFTTATLADQQNT
jgi:short-subunit dehydrogenase